MITPVQYRRNPVVIVIANGNYGYEQFLIDAHGHHVFRVYFRNAVLRQYEKFSMLLRNELCSNNLYDFGLRKDLEHLDEVRHKFQANVGVVLSKM